MKFKVMGHVFQNGEKRIICYGEFSDYTKAHDFKEFLESADKGNPKKPYLFYIEEIKTEGDKYFDEAAGNEEQDDY